MPEQARSAERPSELASDLTALLCDSVLGINNCLLVRPLPPCAVDDPIEQRNWHQVSSRAASGTFSRDLGQPLPQLAYDFLLFWHEIIFIRELGNS